MKKHNLIQAILFMCILTVPSCWVKYVPESYNKEFVNCYHGEDRIINPKFNIDGYYIENEYYTKPYIFYDGIPHYTNSTLMMFFEDGTFINHIVGLDVGESEEHLFERIVSSSKETEFFNNSSYWGIYHISNDTIIMSCINRIRFGAKHNRELLNLKYLIVDKNTLKCIEKVEYSSNQNLQVESRLTQHKDTIIKGKDTIFFYPAQFFALKKKPTSDCWLKQNKWFWCDEEKYKEYMLKRKEKKVSN